MTHTVYRDIAACAEEVAAFRAGLPGGDDGRRYRGICGFDGFIDTFISMQEPDTMAALGPKISAAAGIAASYVAHHRGDKFGGNGPLLAAALYDAFAGAVDTAYIGAIGDGAVQPIFAEALAGKTSELYPLAAPAHSDCLEFTDGKVMLCDMRSCEAVTWQRLLERVGAETLDAHLRASDFIAAVNWGKLPHAGDIWSNLAARVRALGVGDQRVTCFMDLAEFEPRPMRDRHDLLARLPAITEACSTVLSFNLKEAWLMADTVGAAYDRSPAPDAVAACAAALHQAIAVDRIVIHPNDGAACASATGCVYVPGPLCAAPLISTGAGDHFGAGYLAATLAGLGETGALLAGVSASGHFVRSGRSPSFADMADLLDAWSAGTLSERL